MTDTQQQTQLTAFQVSRIITVLEAVANENPICAAVVKAIEGKSYGERRAIIGGAFAQALAMLQLMHMAIDSDEHPYDLIQKLKAHRK